MFTRRETVALFAASVLVGAPPVAAAAQTAALVAFDADGSATEVSMEQLEALPQVTIDTGNAYVDGVVRFRGPLMRDVLDLVGLDDAELVRLTAANDYTVDIPTDDFRSYDAILAMIADGKRLSRRERGPLWLVYPMSQHPELTESQYNRRLIWQVVRIDAR